MSEEILRGWVVDVLGQGVVVTPAVRGGWLTPVHATGLVLSINGLEVAWIASSWLAATLQHF